MPKLIERAPFVLFLLAGKRLPEGHLDGQCSHRENKSAEVATMNTVCKPRRPAGGFLFRNLRQSASQNLSEKNIAVLTAPSFLERFCEADWHNSETK